MKNILIFDFLLFGFENKTKKAHSSEACVVVAKAEYSNECLQRIQHTAELARALSSFSTSIHNETRFVATNEQTQNFQIFCCWRVFDFANETGFVN